MSAAGRRGWGRSLLGVLTIGRQVWASGVRREMKTQTQRERQRQGDTHRGGASFPARINSPTKLGTPLGEAPAWTHPKPGHTFGVSPHQRAWKEEASAFCLLALTLAGRLIYPVAWAHSRWQAHLPCGRGAPSLVSELCSSGFQCRLETSMPWESFRTPGMLGHWLQGLTATKDNR